MKRILILIFTLIFTFSCKKKEKESTPVEPNPVKTGTLTIQVSISDSLGQLENDNSGVTIRLANTSFSGISNAEGKVVFSGLTQTSYYPVFVKEGYEGPPLGINLDSESKSVSVPVAKLSSFKLINLSGQAVNKDSITISFDLDKSIPPGKSCKIAVLSNTTTTSPKNFVSLDFITVSSQSTVKYSIAKLPEFKKFAQSLSLNAIYYVSAVPVSYGSFDSNLSVKPVLMGDNLFYHDDLTFTKNW